MLNNLPYYHGSIRNVITAFGRLFSNIKFERINNAGVVEQIIHVPIAYSQKDKWVQALNRLPGNDKDSYTVLPKLGFEITGYEYDAARALSRMNKIYCIGADGRKEVGMPVPYNIDLNLYFATKTQGDGMQILEQILPVFMPEYSLSVHTIPSIGLIQDVPFSLNGVSVEDDYEGDLETRRFVIHTLNFTAKLSLFGPVREAKLIKQVEVNINDPEAHYVATQETPISVIHESWTEELL